MSDLTTNTSAFGLCSDAWQEEMRKYVRGGGEYQRYWQGQWEDVGIEYRHNLHKDRAYRAKPEPVVTVEVSLAFLTVSRDVSGTLKDERKTIGNLTTTFHDGNPVKAEWVIK